MLPKLDFWNNPIVVSAMRLKYRRSSPGILAAVWAMGLLALGVVLHYIALREPFPVAKTYLLIIFGIQFVLCAAIALISVASSMNAEVNNRTLDFQRIVSLSPQEILVGKMIGEPAVTYFLVMASVPFAVLCWGAGGARASEVLFFYLNLITFILMAAALGLVHSLNPPVAGATRQKAGAGGMVFVVLFIILPQLLFHSRQAMNVPVIGEALQLLTPIGSFVSFWEGNAWRAHVTLWGIEIPSLVAGPIAQLSIAAWVVAAMSRRLKNPLDPAITKRRAYATVLVLDLLLAGIAYAKWRDGSASPGALVYGFCFGHLVVCLVVVFALVPRQTAVLSWIWRRDSHRSRLGDLAFADRSDISLAAVILGLIGPVALAVGFLAPMALAGWPQGNQFPPDRIVEVCLVTLVLVVAAAMLHQVFAAIPKRGGNLLYVLVLLFLNVLPPITAAVLEAPAIRATKETQEFVASLSPAAFYFMNMARWAPDIRGGWLIVLYLFLAAASYRLLQRWLRRQTAVVDHKVETMGLRQAAAPPA